MEIGWGGGGVGGRLGDGAVLRDFYVLYRSFKIVTKS